MKRSEACGQDTDLSHSISLASSADANDPRLAWSRYFCVPLIDPVMVLPAGWVGVA
jgi:hypothetical protein